MNTAIVIPSINDAPPALSRLREIAPDAEIIVVGDRKSTYKQREFCNNIRAQYLGVEEQEALPYTCKDYIAWNSIMRRNLGLLEAVRHGADLLISIDDDNAPNDNNWLHQFEAVFSGENNYTLVKSNTGWFNLGDYANKPFYYRGFPYSQRHTRVEYSHVNLTNHIGIANGLIYGDPDISATERIEKAPEVHNYDFYALDGIALDPCSTWSPVNTQNTAYRRECMALSFALPGVGRYDDIWGSYIAQAAMAGAYCVYFGPPTVTQDRNHHNVFRDLQNELMGMEHTEAFCECLHEVQTIPGDIIGNLDRIAKHLRGAWKLPFPHAFLGAWIDDIGRLF